VSEPEEAGWAGEESDADALELPELPEGIAGAEHLGVRVWSIRGSSHQELTDNIATILGEHLGESDELHVSFNAMQTGSREHAGYHLLKADQPWTELFFEYSALIVLRAPST